MIAQHLGSAVPGNKHPFSALNDAVLADGVFLRILKGGKAARPVQLVWHNNPQVDAAINSQRLLVLAEQHSEATVVEHFSGQGHSFTNGLSELILEAGASLNHSRLHLESAEALHVGGLHAALERDATLNSFHVAFGGKLKRIDIVINHQGHGAHCQLDGMYLLRGQEHVDYHTCIEHAVPHCTTDETFRGIVGDKASAVFNGGIHIHPDAQKTRAELSNKNLLTSATAEVNTKPELEIYADDVQCAHGATVAQLDESMLHYLRTRGIPADEALVLLSYGFINALVEKQGLSPCETTSSPCWQITSVRTWLWTLTMLRADVPEGRVCPAARYQDKPMSFNVEEIRAQFPALKQEVNGRPLVYLDSAATTQKPQAVIDAIVHYYPRDNANVHRAAHALSGRATSAFEDSRRVTAEFLGCANPAQIIWVKA